MSTAQKVRRGLDGAAAIALRDEAPPPLAAGFADVDMGDSASAAALARLNEAIAGLRAMRVAPLLQDAVAAIRAGDSARASEIAIEALNLDDRNGHAWHLLAISREHCDDFRSSIAAYEAALALLPDHADVANDLGRLAFRLGMTEVAAQLFALYREARPTCPQGANNLACALRDLHEYQAAIDILKLAIEAEPTSAMLWNTLATVVIARGDTANAVPFLTEAVRLEHGFARARYTRANARVEFGDIDGAIEDLDHAIATSEFESDRAMMRFARAHTLLLGGRVAEGWDAYEARFAPQFASRLNFLIDRPRWAPEAALTGKSMLLIGEQGLGDEVMFANILPDVIDALGPAGRLSVAVEPRLVPLFRRSFPGVAFTTYADLTLDGHSYRIAQGVDEAEFDLWAPLAAPLRRFRPSVESFPNRGGYLTPDPARIEHWRATLSGLPGRKVGILWKSLKLDGARLREFSPFEGWRPVLEAPGVTFVNLQYGECDVELAHAREAFGVDIWRPPGIDLKDDLDDLAALCCALDLVLGPANATTNIAGACGAVTWFISTPMAWPRLGADRYPWYPSVRAFIAHAYGQWDVVMGEIALALGQGN
ncbi:MAG TPA: tetratricopeptide repeat protein [Caulobacteraceae bacterium]|nr:tetratricopeptide repeat protein [Caulobacteraceae bacterium]